MSMAKEYSTICPYLMLESIENEIAFLIRVFNSKIKDEKKAKDGLIIYGEMIIGDSIIMMGKARPDYPARESMNYVFVDDVDIVYEKAMKSGATSIMEPGDRYYGYRECGFADPQGNQWWVGSIQEELSNEELKERANDLNPG